ncbi:phosphatase PAP2 family protein [Tumebacillus algifaecis]|uniref:phosphatase PAP2 family protein n=1 Tax=Tumebacillus algifaecis TaxID=1214604 RepID=UPI0012FD8891|nr:phosphatase PAP2 family protein [Tumebacillus algifaecis]
MLVLKKVSFPVLIAATAAVLFAVFQVQSWGMYSLVVLLLALLGTKQDANEISWRKFLPAGFITLFAFYMIYKYGGPMWNEVISFQTKNIRHFFQWNEWFNSIPFNDAAWARVWQPEWLTNYLAWVYMNGFTLSYWICVIRAFFTKDVKRLALYSLAGYLLQVPLILPFYNTILLQEVWFVQGTPDLLARPLTPEQQFTTAWNCFPSMHTSIAFAAILLSLREKSRWYKWVIGFYCWSIIFSTLYLKIHWVIDMFAGMLFAYGCVKLADLIVNSKWFARFVERFLALGEWLQEGRMPTQSARVEVATAEKEDERDVK